MNRLLAIGASAWGLLACSCQAPSTPDRLMESSPPPSLGRPEWVEVVAGVGSAAGMTLGSVVSVGLMPATWLLTEACSESLSQTSRSELLWFPATGLAAVGHAAFGAPADMFDYTLRRAWIEREDPVATSEIGPLAEPELPAPATVEADR